MIEFYKDAAGEWRWRAKAMNGATMADSGEGYTREVDVKRAFDRFRDLLPQMKFQTDDDVI